MPVSIVTHSKRRKTPTKSCVCDSTPSADPLITGRAVLKRRVSHATIRRALGLRAGCHGRVHSPQLGAPGHVSECDQSMMMMCGIMTRYMRSCTKPPGSAAEPHIRCNDPMARPTIHNTSHSSAAGHSPLNCALALYWGVSINRGSTCINNTRRDGRVYHVVTGMTGSSG